MAPGPCARASCGSCNAQQPRYAGIRPGCINLEITLLLVLCAMFGSSRGTRTITEGTHMQFNFAIETSKPSGSTFRMAFGITIPLVLVLMALLAWLR